MVSSALEVQFSLRHFAFKSTEKCFEMIKNTMNHSFNMMHHRGKTHVERGPGFDQDTTNCLMNKLMLTMKAMTICS